MFHAGLKNISLVLRRPVYNGRIKPDSAVFVDLSKNMRLNWYESPVALSPFKDSHCRLYESPPVDWEEVRVVLRALRFHRESKQTAVVKMKRYGERG